MTELPGSNPKVSDYWVGRKRPGSHGHDFHPVAYRCKPLMWLFLKLMGEDQKRWVRANGITLPLAAGTHVVGQTMHWGHDFVWKRVWYEGTIIGHNHDSGTYIVQSPQLSPRIMGALLPVSVPVENAEPSMATIERLNDQGLRELMRQTREEDLLRALHEPKLEAIRLRCLENMPAGMAQRFRDDWAWMQYDRGASHRAQERVTTAFLSMLFLGVVAEEGQLFT